MTITRHFFINERAKRREPVPPSAQQQQQQQQHLFKHDKEIQQKLMWSCTDNKTKFLTKSNKTKFLTNYKKTNVRFLHIFNNKILHSTSL